MEKAETNANWIVNLACNCPGCGKNVDLLDSADFWDGRKDMQVGECDTERTNKMEVSCPECGHEFEVCCTYE